MLFPNIGNEFFRGDALFFGAQHNGRTVSIVGSNVMNLMATHSLKADPNIRLDIFHQMPNMDLAIGVG